MENKITKREMYEAIIEMVNGGEMKYDATEFVAFCENEIALLDKKAVKAKERAAVKRAEGDELTAAVEAVLGDEFEVIADIAARVEGEDVTVAKVTYRLGQLVKAGKAEKTEMTLAGKEGQKARKVVAYKRA